MSAMTSIDGGRTLRGGVLLAAVVAAGLAGAALQGERGGGEGDALAPAPATPVASGAPVAQGSPAVAAERPIGRTARSARRDVVAAASRVDPDIARRAEVGAALEELERLHGYAGELGWDEAKALVERRRQATDDLVLRLARLGPGGARAISSAYARAGGVRARLVLIQALAKVGDDEAAPTLASLLARERAFSLRSEMLRALGARSEADGAARDALVAVLASDGDPRLRSPPSRRSRVVRRPCPRSSIASSTTRAWTCGRRRSARSASSPARPRAPPLPGSPKAPPTRPCARRRPGSSPARSARASPGRAAPPRSRDEPASSTPTRRSGARPSARSGSGATPPPATCSPRSPATARPTSPSAGSRSPSSPARSARARSIPSPFSSRTRPRPCDGRRSGPSHRAAREPRLGEVGPAPAASLRTEVSARARGRRAGARVAARPRRASARGRGGRARRSRPRARA